jgi:nitrous oxide reductase
MSYTILKQKVYTASKDYPCDACESLTVDDFMSNPKDYGVSFADKRILVKIRQENYKVLKGTNYLYQAGIFDGDFYALKCRLDAVNIINKYNLNEE